MLFRSKLIIIDTLADKHGRPVRIGYRGSDVEIAVTPPIGRHDRIVFDGEQRDRFIKAWAEAERVIEETEHPLPRAANCPGCGHPDGAVATRRSSRCQHVWHQFRAQSAVEAVTVDA